MATVKMLLLLLLLLLWLTEVMVVGIINGA
jgi:hypothetical protein